jgi:hypothetical protein
VSAAKFTFGTATYGANGLSIKSETFVDGLKSATFKWIGTGAAETCKAVYTQDLTAATQSGTWLAGQKMTTDLTTEQEDAEAIVDWAGLSKHKFTVTLDSDDLTVCGFQTITQTSDPDYYSADHVTYKNTLCGNALYTEW